MGGALYVVRLPCFSLLLALYSIYLFWYVPTDIIAFAREDGFSMEVEMGSRTNLREVLELLEVI